MTSIIEAQLYLKLKNSLKILKLASRILIEIGRNFPTTYVGKSNHLIQISERWNYPRKNCPQQSFKLKGLYSVRIQTIITLITSTERERS